MRPTSIVIALAAGLLAAPARGADVHIGINIGVPPPPPPIVVETPPPLVVVPRTPVYYAPGVPYNFFYYDGLYYVFHAGYWFSATTSRGPWVYARRVPRPVRAVPVRYHTVPDGRAKPH